MKKKLFMTLVLLTFLACTGNEPTVKNPLKKNVDLNKTTKINTNVNNADFVPEHIKRSRIEVVKHY